MAAAVSTDSFSMKSYHSAQTSSSVVPREQPQEQQQQPPEARPGNPDEIWILRQGKQSAHKIWVSDLVEKRYTDVSGLRKFLTREEFPDWEKIPPDDIFIKKHGANGWLAGRTPISELAGNKEEEPHLVEVKVGKSDNAAKSKC